MTEIVCAIICGILALIALVISVRSFKEKGFLFNNAYIWASKQEREQMNKKPHYRQSAIAFALIAAIGLSMMSSAGAVIAIGTGLYVGARILKALIAKEIKNEDTKDK